MNFYRSSIYYGDAEDITSSYTVKVNKKLQQTTLTRYFSQNNTFNDKVIIGNNVNNCAFMLQYCNNFNSEVIIGRNVKVLYHFLYACNNFNRNIIIPDKAENCCEMFYLCEKMSSKITFGKNMVDCVRMFQGCYQLSIDNDVTLPKSVALANGMFAECGRLNIPNLYINNINCGISYMLSSWHNSRINIFCEDLTEIVSLTQSDSIVGGKITWTPMTNGYYNALRNIYLYNNYLGT